MKELEQYFRALGDTNRLRILNLLLHGELCVFGSLAIYVAVINGYTAAKEKCPPPRVGSGGV